MVDESYPLEDAGDFELNQFIGTVMSYVNINSSYSPSFIANWGFAAGPMAFDIATIQYLYGINTNYNTGNDTYYLPTVNAPGTYWISIWDAGGNDTISAQNATNSAVINLNDATLLNNDPGAGGLLVKLTESLVGLPLPTRKEAYLSLKMLSVANTMTLSLVMKAIIFLKEKMVAIPFTVATEMTSYMGNQVQIVSSVVMVTICLTAEQVQIP